MAQYSKKVIFGFIESIENYKKHDPTCKKRMARLKYLSDENQKYFQILQTNPTGDANDKLNQYTLEYNELKEEHEKYLINRYETFVEVVPKFIWDLVIEDRIQEEHVLDMIKTELSLLDDVQKGKISEADAQRSILALHQQRLNLPSDFFTGK